MKITDVEKFLSELRRYPAAALLAIANISALLCGLMQRAVGHQIQPFRNWR
jgi:hypothetical protein